MNFLPLREMSSERMTKAGASLIEPPRQAPAFACLDLADLGSVQRMAFFAVSFLDRGIARPAPTASGVHLKGRQIPGAAGQSLRPGGCLRLTIAIDNRQSAAWPNRTTLVESQDRRTLGGVRLRTPDITAIPVY
jgi:hypothetical protein